MMHGMHGFVAATVPAIGPGHLIVLAGALSTDGLNSAYECISTSGALEVLCTVVLRDDGKLGFICHENASGRPMGSYSRRHLEMPPLL